MNLVFAFGSNLSEVQMRRRCPAAALVGTATLRGYRLAFAGFSMTWQGAVATILPARGLRVPGVLYAVAPEDLARLDRFEGVPFLYSRQERGALDRRRHQTRPAHVYELPANTPLGEPSSDYVLTILRAYRQLGLSLDALASALAFSKERSQ